MHFHPVLPSCGYIILSGVHRKFPPSQLIDIHTELSPLHIDASHLVNLHVIASSSVPAYEQ